MDPQSPAGSSVTRSLAVLVVEDDAGLARSIGACLAKRVRPLLASSVASALALLAEEHRSIVGVISDVQLPDGLGFEVLDAARAQIPEIPLLMMTGEIRADVVNRAASYRLTFLGKPFQLTALAQFLDDCLAKRSEEDGGTFSADACVGKRD